MGRVSDKKPSGVELPPSDDTKTREKPEYKSQTKTPPLTKAEHNQQVERDLIRIAYKTLWLVIGAIVIIAIGVYVLRGAFGWDDNDYIRSTISILSAVATLILGYLFGTGRK